MKLPFANFRRFRRALPGLLIGVALASLALAEPVDVSTLPPPASTQADFVRDVQPILAKHCYSCHGPDKQEGDLRWDVKAAALKGGASGPAIVISNSAASRVIHLVAGLEKNLVMPKKGARLAPEQIGLLRAWIDQGATWPDAVATRNPRINPIGGVSSPLPVRRCRM